MVCDRTLTPGQTLEERMKEVDAALKALETAINSGNVKLTIAPNGQPLLTGWGEKERKGLTDACTYRTLAVQGSFALKQAQQAAERLSGRKINGVMLNSGVHTHNGGKTWHKH